MDSFWVSELVFLENAKSKEGHVFKLGRLGRDWKTCPRPKGLLQDKQCVYVRKNHGTEKWAALGHLIKRPSLSHNPKHCTLL